MLERLTREGHAAARSEVAREAAFRVGERAPHHRGDLLVGEWLEAIDAKPGQERRVHLEVGVLGGAPASVTVPSSTCGSSASCWAY